MVSEVPRKNDDVEFELLKTNGDGVDMTFEDYYNNYKVNDDTRCGIWIFKGPFLQRLASKKSYTVIYGLVGCLYSAAFAYFNGTISTIEKRLKISSTSTGFISTGNNISQTCLSIFLTYYVSKQHQPRWMAIGILAVVLFCLLSVLPHFIFGAGDYSLSLTEEYGAQCYKNITEVLESENGEINDLCSTNRSTFSFDCNSESETSESNISQILLFCAQFISGFGGAIFSSLGITYMDDNIKKTHAPIFLSATTFIRMLGPAFGYTISSYSLNYYIAPHLHPVIDRNDPRWIGAWWLGWIVLAILLFFGSFFLCLFPRELPRARARKEFQKTMDKKYNVVSKPDSSSASWKDMKGTVHRLITNKMFMYGNLSMMFMLFGYLPYMTYGPKYMEIQFKVSSTMASLVSGTLALVFPSLGLLISAYLISKFQPSGRFLSGWALFERIFTLIAIILYTFIGCEENDTELQITISQTTNLSSMCDISSCNCEFTKYSPICGSDNVTYISPCHGGCLDRIYEGSDIVGYTNCSCISYLGDNISSLNYIASPKSTFDAIPGSCQIDCTKYFIMFLIVNCLGQFLGGSQIIGSFLIAVRCIDERDKAVSISLTMLLLNIFAVVPASLVFGYIFDSACIVWGKTCNGDGNCWLYDSYNLRKTMNHASAIFSLFAVVFEIFVWYYAKNLNVFDEIKNKLNDESGESKTNKTDNLEKVDGK